MAKRFFKSRETCRFFAADNAARSAGGDAILLPHRPTIRYDHCMLESLRDMLSREPFVPFRVVMSSGDRYTVHDPALAVLMESQLFLAEPRSDRFHLLRLNQIVAVEAISAAA